ncbi:MAG: 30S ribosomal protein THX [Chitinophagaceae bacterium]|nr:30S ribosomal protein THX [Chitinophagaceae bacterium]
MCGGFSIFTAHSFFKIKIFTMGRGDKKTAKGKRFKGSFGKSRPANGVKSKKLTVKQA